jgi:hypothetical protein
VFDDICIYLIVWLSVIFVIVKTAVLWGVGPCILVLVYQTVEWHNPENGSHCSEDLKYNFCGFLACCMAFWQVIFSRQKGFEVQRKGRGSERGKFWNNRTISVAILFAVPTSQTSPPELPFVWDNCSTSYCISRPIRHTFFFPEKCLNSTCVFRAEDK